MSREERNKSNSIKQSHSKQTQKTDQGKPESSLVIVLSIVKLHVFQRRRWQYIIHVLQSLDKNENILESKCEF